jgi:hypothetical protein
MDECRATIKRVYGTVLPVPITPWWSSLPPISRSFYEKAAKENASLTPVERLYLLSRLDLPGKALARPDSITEVERDLLLGRPPPETLADNIRRFFPPASPEPEPVGGEGGERSGGQQQQAGRRYYTTAAEVADAFRDPERLASLSLEALECVSLGWWTLTQEHVPAPWTDWGQMRDDASAEAAGILLDSMRPGEKAFEDAARDLWLAPEMGEKVGLMERENDATEEGHLKVLEKMEQYAADAALLREELRAEVARKLEELSGEDRTALEELRERMRVEVARDAEEDAPRKAEAQKRKREREEIVEARNKRYGETGYMGEDDSVDDSEEEGWVLGRTIFD